VYGEDPTVNRLEKRAAEIFGKEAALFVPTGCMGNLVAIKTWTHHGDEVICEERSHVNLYELASMSAIAGCMPRVARGEDGILTWKQIEAVIRPKIYYGFADRRLVRAWKIPRTWREEQFIRRRRWMIFATTRTRWG